MTDMLWCDVAVTPHFSWPSSAIALPFEGRLIVLSPPSDRLACRVSLLDPNRTTFEEGGTIVSRFLSRLAWSRDGGISELFHSGSNMPGRPGLLGQGTYERTPFAAEEPPNSLYIPTGLSAEAELALALYREGLSVNSIPFAFLSLFKILNIRFSSGSAQERWLNENLAKLRYDPAVNRLQEIQKQHRDVGHYLYVQGRCAVAHANSSPLVNPDEFSDRRRLEFDFPLLKELVALYIEQELDVLSDSTFNKIFDPKIHSEQALMRGKTEQGWILYEPFK